MNLDKSNVSGIFANIWQFNKKMVRIKSIMQIDNVNNHSSILLCVAEIRREIIMVQNSERLSLLSLEYNIDLNVYKYK